MTMILYALRCDEGYIKVVESGLEIVDMQKASVFKAVSDLPPIMERAWDIKGVCAVELTITERKLQLSHK